MIKNKIERPYKLAVLRDRNGDLSMEWYIEFYAFDESIQDLKRKRVKIPMSFATTELRRKCAAKMIAESGLQLIRLETYFCHGSVSSYKGY